MLKGIATCISPDLLKVLAEMVDAKNKTFQARGTIEQLARVDAETLADEARSLDAVHRSFQPDTYEDQVRSLAA